MLSRITSIVKNYRGIGSNRLAKFLRQFYREQHQLTSVTSADRYPELFNEAARAMGPGKGHGMKILSFGCSTGEECTTLLTYFPEAKIVGVDINKSNLRKAKRNHANPNIVFLESTPEIINKEGSFHLVFCLSVLCRWEDTKDLQNCATIYPFDKYNSTIEMLTRCLRVNGVIVIFNSNFRFEDTDSFLDFETVDTPNILSSGFVNKFDRFNQAIAEGHRYCIYRKVSES